MDVFTWMLFGLVVGVIANVLDPRPSGGGLIGAIVLGVVGALVGGFLGSSLFGVGVTGFNFSSLAVAVAGAMLLLFIGRQMRRA